MDRAGKTPIFLAAQYGYTPMVEFLLNHGADPELENSLGWTVLHQAVSSRSPEVVANVLGHLRVDPRVLVRHKDHNQRTALHQAAVIGADETIINTLLRNGADAMAVDNNGNTPYDLAKKSNAAAPVQRLLSGDAYKQMDQGLFSSGSFSVAASA
jgi:ankyrin repeat protein